MKDTVAYRYALALYDLAKETNKIDIWQEQMRLVKKVFVKDRSLKTFFDKFTRIDDSTTRTTRGTGLGLFIVKGLVEGMGGEIRLYSNEECGFCVKLYLPLVVQEEIYE